ncbi:MAG TPA: thiol-disulfide oxidoreductase DCC family protein [Ignavibacteria bacterium]|nr:thiol-disulfide oxidoreductase DCC family protein [Ignavibacteria bacterium]
MKPEYIILFDGVCNFCNSTINFLIDRDKENKFKFGALQSDAGQYYLKKFGLNTDDFDTFVLVNGDKFYTKSTAALKISKELPGLYKLLYAFIIIPPPLRNLVYDFIAKNRYKIFGKTDSCRMPTPELKAKFLN